MRKKLYEKNFFTKTNIALISFSVLMFLISVSFFYLLSVKTSAQLSPGEGSDFGISEILFSIVFAAAIGFLFLWIKKIMIKNPYMGLITGIVLLAAFEYSLFFRFKGFYTTIFAILTAFIVLGYLGFFFFKYRK